MIQDLVKRYDAVLFDVGNTLVVQNMTGTNPAELVPRTKQGVSEVIAALSGRVALGVVSNTTEMTADQLGAHLDTVGIKQHLRTIVATADLGVHKPDPAPLRIALESVGIRGDRALYVGDNEIDRIAARGAGMDFCYAGPDLVHAMTRFAQEPASALSRAINMPMRPDDNCATRFRSRLDQLAKPLGSLGRLEHFASQIAAIQCTEEPVVDPCAVAIFCADHGIAADDTVTPWPQAISGVMASTIVAGKATSSVFADMSDVYMEVLDVGLLAADLDERVRREKVCEGTRDMRSGRTMTRDEVLAALEVGASTAERLIAGGSKLLCVGEVGMGNTTSAAALISHFCGVDPRIATGRGAGIDDETLHRKREVVADAVARVGSLTDPVSIAEVVGGAEVVAMAGFIVGAASLRTPVLLDGVVTQAAACLARAMVPESIGACLAAHRSAEPASTGALVHLGLHPILDLDLRLGEGTGALLAVPLLRAACGVVGRVATLADLDDREA